MDKETIGTVLSVAKQWWLKVNTKLIRMGALDGATFPHIIKFNQFFVVRLVPNLPILNIKVETVSPTLVVVANNMLENSRPLSVVLRWENT